MECLLDAMHYARLNIYQILNYKAKKLEAA